MWLQKLLDELDPPKPEPMPFGLQMLAGALTAAGIIMVLIGASISLSNW